MTILDCYLEQWHNTCTYIMWCCVLEGYYAANVSSSRLRRAFQKFGQRLSNLCQNGYTALTVACCYGHAVFWQGRSYILPSCPHYLWVAGKNVRLASLDVYPQTTRYSVYVNLLLRKLRFRVWQGLPLLTSHSKMKLGYWFNSALGYQNETRANHVY